MNVIESTPSPRLRTGFFYPLIGVLVLVLFIGLAYRQLFSKEAFVDRERLQNQRRILIPGPRGEIFDRDGRVLVANRARFSAVMFFSDEILRQQFRQEYIRVRRDTRDGLIPPPASGDYETAARVNVVQRYLDECNHILGRDEVVNAKALVDHFHQQPLLPFPILDDLESEEFARLLEQLPAGSPVQIYSSTVRHYPYGNAASHTLGYVSSTIDLPRSDLPGEDLKTFYGRGTYGRDGLERQFDSVLQGKTGSEIWIVDPAGFQVRMIDNKPPVQGQPLYTSLDVDLQLAGEQAFGEREGALVAIDVRTGEVLAVVSRPDYDLNELTPYISRETFDRINERGAWINRATQGLYPPGSTFKVIAAIAGLRTGAIRPESEFLCTGHFQVPGRQFPCHNRGGHGTMDLVAAIRQSCNVYFYNTGLQTGADAMAREARRFALDHPTGIELPGESNRMLVPDTEWKRNSGRGGWVPIDTANMAIGQGFLDVSPLQMACFTASLARGETLTQPTILRRERDWSPAYAGNQSLGLNPADRAAILAGMEECVARGTAKFARIPGVRLAGKTGTAQKQTPRGTLELAWTIIYGPIEAPAIAIAVIVVGDRPDAENAGGRNAAPVAKQVLDVYFQKHPVDTLIRSAAPAF